MCCVSIICQAGPLLSRQQKIGSSAFGEAKEAVLPIRLLAILRCCVFPGLCSAVLQPDLFLVEPGERRLARPSIWRVLSLSALWDAANNVRHLRSRKSSGERCFAHSHGFHSCVLCRGTADSHRHCNRTSRISINRLEEDVDLQGLHLNAGCFQSKSSTCFCSNPSNSRSTSFPSRVRLSHFIHTNSKTLTINIVLLVARFRPLPIG